MIFSESRSGKGRFFFADPWIRPGKFLLVPVLLILAAPKSVCQETGFHGQAAGWTTVNNSGSIGFQAGVRYLPQFLFNESLSKSKYHLSGELSLDGYGSYTSQTGGTSNFDGSLKLYRSWLSFSGERYEIRAGLQKINFGSANILRPLMWFDRVDPRDPLHLTAGVAGVLGRYYFKNNANIWLWTLLGNDQTKGWETIPSDKWRPEFGGRLQLPVPKGEIAFTYHNREARFPADSTLNVTGPPTFTENRVGFDSKIDLGVGLWIEGTISQRSHPDIPDYDKALTLGADYTFDIGEGLNVMAENMFISSSESLFETDNNVTLTGLSLTLPLSVITRANVIIFYDWKNNGWYNFANLSFTFDKFAVNIIGFSNPRSFAIFNYDNRGNLFAGYGGQVMVVYNH